MVLGEPWIGRWVAQDTLGGRQQSVDGSPPRCYETAFMPRAWKLILLLVLWAIPSRAAAMPRFCTLLLATLANGVPVLTLPTTAELSEEDVEILRERELSVAESVGSGSWGFWKVFSSVVERESFFSIRASALFAASYDEPNHHWVADEDALQFRVFSARALIDQCTLLGFMEAHVALFHSEETEEVIDEATRSFLENGRRRLVFLGNHDARLLPLKVALPDKPVRIFPSLQWDFPQDPEALKPFVNFLGVDSLDKVKTGRVTMAVAPRFQAESLELNQVWVQRGPSGQALFVIPWQQFVNNILGGVELPPSNPVKLQFLYNSR